MRQILIFFCIGSCLALGIGCQRIGILNGDIFIVTQGGQNIKLGLVQVSVIPETVIVNDLVEKIKHANSEMRALNPKLVQTRKEYEMADSIFQIKASKRDERFEQYLGSIFNSRLKRLYEIASDTSRKYLQIKSEKKSEYDKVKEEYQYWTSDEFYFSNLPEGIAVTKTDADGKFSLPIERRGLYAISAVASRSVGDETEKYYWLIWTSLNGEKSGRLLLSNDNLTASNPENGVFQSVLKKTE